ncbi:MAG TPA: gamma-glutamyltransferase [Thermomicrobiales bacterium]|nr:gamma-glutamyltransferase [Thermomicrobiales bacterium]
MAHGRETTLRVTRDLAVSKNVMVAAKHPWAVQAGLDILASGGNAVDAAAATAFAVGVVEPWMSGIGGVGFMTIQKSSGERVVIDYFGRAPQAARADMFEMTDDARTVVGFGGVRDRANEYGPLSVLVPGMVAGMALALEQHGTKEIGEVIQAAIRCADEGFEVNWYNGMLLASQQAVIRRDPETTKVYLGSGGPPAPLFGQPLPRIRQPELANTLRRIASHGRDGFYRGETAECIADHLQSVGGIMTTDDLARFEPTVVEPLVIEYQGHELVLLPFQGGGITLAESFNILDGLNIRGTGLNTATTLHHIAEASRRSFADRFKYVGDPDWVDIDWDRLASKEYGDERRAEIEANRASSPQPGQGIAGRAGITREMAVTADGGCTTHLSVVDAEGNMVSVTQTLTLIFGSAVTIPGAGVLMNDSMALFEPAPGRANSIGPWKRPASNMAHIIAVKDGTPVLAVGAPGGRRIIDTCMQMALDVIDFDLDIQSACQAPLVDCSGPELLVDTQVSQATRDRLRAMGHTVVDAEPAFAPRAFASPTGVQVDPETGVRYGGADPFGIGIAAGM